MEGGGGLKNKLEGGGGGWLNKFLGAKKRGLLEMGLYLKDEEVGGGGGGLNSGSNSS